MHDVKAEKKDAQKFGNIPRSASDLLPAHLLAPSRALTMYFNFVLSPPSSISRFSGPSLILAYPIH
jgi:hypothetical protein